MNTYFFEDLPKGVQQAVFDLAYWIADPQKLDHDDVHQYGLEQVLTETIDDLLNRYNKPRKISEWFVFAERINEYL